MPHKKLIAVDFDGVIHAYTTPWSDAATISDGPTPGAMAFLRSLVEDERFEVVVVSSKLKEDDGEAAVFQWLWHRLHDAFGLVICHRVHGEISFSRTRPPAFLTIDDRGWLPPHSALCPRRSPPVMDRPPGRRPHRSRGAACWRSDACLTPFSVSASRQTHP